MILHHDDDGTLIDGYIHVAEPIALLAECVEEAIRPPDPAMPAEEMAQRTHDFARRVRQARESRCRRDRAIVEIRRMSRISFRITACGETPAGLAITLEVAGIRDAVRAIDRHMAQVLLPIVGIPVASGRADRVHKKNNA